MFVDYKPSTYDKYTYPTWADVIGWLMALACVVAIPIVMVVKISGEKEGRNIWQVSYHYYSRALKIIGTSSFMPDSASECEVFDLHIF